MNHIDASVLEVADRDNAARTVSAFLEGASPTGVLDSFDRLAGCARTQLALRQEERDASSRIMRSHLLDKMFMRENALCVICAPCGFGKTELANQYRARLGTKRRVPWLDASGIAFKTLLKKIEPRRFLRKLGRGSVLVVDDVPLLDEQSAFSFKRLVEACCAGGHEVVVTTRHRFVAALFEGQATFVDAKELLFSSEERKSERPMASRSGKASASAGKSLAQDASNIVLDSAIPSFCFHGEYARSQLVEFVMHSSCATVVEAVADLIALLRPTSGEVLDQLVRLLSGEEAALLRRSFPHVFSDEGKSGDAPLLLSWEERLSLWRNKGQAMSALLEPRVRAHFGVQSLPELVAECLAWQKEVSLAAALLTEHASLAEKERFARKHGWRLLDEGCTDAVLQLWAESRWFDLDIPELLMLSFALMFERRFAQARGLMAEAAKRSQGTVWRAVVCLVEEAFLDPRFAEEDGLKPEGYMGAISTTGLSLLDELWEREELERFAAECVNAEDPIECLVVSLAALCRTSFADAFSQIERIVAEERLAREEECAMAALLAEDGSSDGAFAAQPGLGRKNLVAVCFLLAFLRHASRRGIAVGKQVSQDDLERLVEKSLAPITAHLGILESAEDSQESDARAASRNAQAPSHVSLLEGALVHLARELADECGLVLVLSDCGDKAGQELERALRFASEEDGTSAGAEGREAGRRSDSRSDRCSGSRSDDHANGRTGGRPDGRADGRKGGEVAQGRPRAIEGGKTNQPLAVVGLRVFGAFGCKVFTQDGVSDVHLRDKARVFVTLLAMKHGREVSRDWISRVLWPEERCNGPKHVSLNSMWSTVTRAMGGKGGCVFAMTKNRNSVMMNDEWTVSDLAELEKVCALVEGGHELDRRELLFAMKDLYRGELLPGCRNEEVVACRKSWKRRVCDLLTNVAQELVDAGDHDLALSYLDFAQQVDPLSERVCWLQSNVLCEIKQYFEAMDAIITYRKQTREQYATEGSARLNELYEQLLAEAE